jgi:hypothetical protein
MPVDPQAPNTPDTRKYFYKILDARTYMLSLEDIQTYSKIQERDERTGTRISAPEFETLHAIYNKVVGDSR